MGVRRGRGVAGEGANERVGGRARLRRAGLFMKGCLIARGISDRASGGLCRVGAATSPYGVWPGGGDPAGPFPLVPVFCRCRFLAVAVVSAWAVAAACGCRRPGPSF
jgi:hypothetical protein